MVLLVVPARSGRCSPYVPGRLAVAGAGGDGRLMRSGIADFAASGVIFLYRNQGEMLICHTSEVSGVIQPGR